MGSVRDVPGSLLEEFGVGGGMNWWVHSAHERHPHSLWCGYGTIEIPKNY